MKRRPLIFACLLAVAAIALKLVNPQLPENFALFGTLALFCGCFLRGPLSWCLPVAALVISDFAGQWVDDYLLGSYSVLAMCLNYFGLAVMCGVGRLNKLRDSLVLVACTAVVGSSAFFLISNFGAWLDPRMGYPRSALGLLECYAAGLPFSRGTLASDVLFSLASFTFYRRWFALPSEAVYPAV